MAASKANARGTVRSGCSMPEPVPKPHCGPLPPVRSACSRATEALDNVQTTGQSLGRVMLVETMGRYAGWIALEAGAPSGADVILLPEIEFDCEAVVAVCRAREAAPRFTTVCVAEGAKPRGGEATVRARVDEAPDLVHGHIARSELAKVVGQTRRVPPDHELLRCMRCMRGLGVSLGEAEGPSRAPLTGQLS